MTAVADLLKRARIMPVLTVSDANDAEPLAHALAEGGLTALEVTLRTPVALEVIRRAAKARPDLAVGAGTILSPDDYKRCEDAGAAFGVSPGWSEPILKAAEGGSMPLLPGAATPSDVLRLRDAGYRTTKFFPAETLGGAATLKAWAGPLYDMTFCPTGGLTAAKAPEYLALNNVLCVGGGWMAPAEAIAAKDWDWVTRAAREALAGVA